MKKKKGEPKILYKYRYFDANYYHIRTILNNEFYFASKDELNDPFDLSLRPKYELATEEQLLTNAKEVIERNKTLTYEMRKQKWIEMSKMIKENKAGYIRHYISAFEKTMTHVGVCSFTADIWDNVLMWTHYCHNHTGFCIGINWAYLSQYLWDLSPRRITPYKVEYGEKVKSIKLYEGDDLKVFKQLFSYKFSAWNYENEVRLISSEHAKSTISLPNDCIEEVILGLNCSEANTSLIKNLLKLKNENIPLYKIVRNEENFKFDRILIDY